MKYLLLFLTVLTIKANAQTTLNFNKRFVDCENKWVALKGTTQDSIYMYGFIYMDVSAGLSVQEEGTFKIINNNTYLYTKRPPTATYIVRLQDNQVKVAWIPAEKLKELDVTDPPAWLKYYKTDTTSAAYLFRWGFTYNGGNEIQKALSYLERVEKIDPNYPGLEFEFIYAYNALKQYDKAAAMIENALKLQPNNGNLYKELVFAQVNSNQMDKAEETYKQGITHCSASVKTEMAFNILYTYYRQKNKAKFDYWANDIQQWVPITDSHYAGLTKMKETFGK